MKNVLNRFLEYVAIDTTSDPSADNFPSTSSQTEFLKRLKQECEMLGLSDVEMDEYGYVMATIPANTSEALPVIGFVAHVDTSPDMSGEGVKPRVVEAYDGKDIVLNESLGIVTRVADFPELALYKGQTLVVSDGTTLLGADDKAGVAEILSAAEYLMAHPEILHGKIRIAFTPDEEIGRGADHFSVERFGADFAYTMDGGRLGQMEYETFNAASCDVVIYGRNVHPGYAKGKMINALRVAMEIDRLLPDQRPETTEDRQGFWHLNAMDGGVEKATMHYIIRDHSRETFEQRKKQLVEICNSLQREGLKIECVVKDQYYNMADVIRNGYMQVVRRAEEAMREIGVVPAIDPIRGGTDGCRLTYMGLPCPNLFAGGENFHSRNEYVSVDTMEKAVELIVAICKKR